MTEKNEEEDTMMEKLSVSQFYSEATRSGVILGLKCVNGHVTVPPRHSCRVCNSEELTVTSLSGIGRVVSFTKVYTKSAEFPLQIPYNLALVQLEEGGSLFGIIEEEEGKSPTFGLKVKVRFKKIPEDSDRPRIFFDPIDSN